MKSSCSISNAPTDSNTFYVVRNFNWACSNFKLSKVEHNDKLENFKINVKIKLAALWASVMFCYIYEDYFELYVPKRIERIISGESLLNTPMKLFAASFVLIIPALMIFLSILLQAKSNRFFNLIFGTCYTVLMLWIAINYSDKWLSFAIVFAIVESFITSMIVWYAWKWPRHNELKGWQDAHNRVDGLTVCKWWGGPLTPLTYRSCWNKSRTGYTAVH